MKCPVCGNPIKKQQKFCHRCGYALNQSAGKGGSAKRKRYPVVWMVLLGVVLLGCIGGVLLWQVLRGDTPASSDTTAIVDYQEVNETLTGLKASEDYAAATTEEKADRMLAALSELGDKGMVTKDSVSYDSDAKVITFSYADGVLGAILLEPSGTDLSGVTDSYVASYDESLIESQVTINVAGSPYTEDATALIVSGLGAGFEDRTAYLQSDGQEKWSGEYLNTSLLEDPTAADLRSGLSGYDLIAIQQHGFLYGDIPTIVLQETVSMDWLIALKSGTDLSAENQAYMDDLRANRIIMLLGSEEEDFQYALLPDFFTYYYGGDGLDGAIVWLGNCSGYINDTLVKAFADCGAKSVLGCTADVISWYDLRMQDAFVYALLYGETVGEALEFAASTWGATDQAFVGNYMSELVGAKEGAAEIRCYIGSEGVLVTLTDEALAALEDPTRAAYTAYYEKILELQQEYGIASMAVGDYETDLQGLCFAKLVDYDNNGLCELLLAYCSGADAYGNYTYQTEVWGYSEDHIELLTQGGCYFGNDAYASVELYEIDGAFYTALPFWTVEEYAQWWPVGGDMSMCEGVNLWSYQDDVFQPVMCAGWYWSSGQASYLIGGETVSVDEYNRYYALWDPGIQTYWLGDSTSDSAYLSKTLEVLEATIQELRSYLTEEEVEEETTASSDAVAYGQLLSDIYDHPQDYYEMMEDLDGSVNLLDVEENQFAICDINSDGVDELVVAFRSTYTAAMVTTIWTLDADREPIVYGGLGVSCDFYSNGCVVVYASHNQGYGDAVWPYTIRAYDASQGGYVDIGWGYSTDKSVALDGNPYSAELDKDGDGVLYYLSLEGEEDVPLTQEEYDAKFESLCPASQKLTLDYQSLTEENIQGLSAEG